ncbi:UNVERIFIED_CONTAM: hypothetical protein Sindi_2624900 [Sesamum indicum]
MISIEVVKDVLVKQSTKFTLRSVSIYFGFNANPIPTQQDILLSGPFRFSPALTLELNHLSISSLSLLCISLNDPSVTFRCLCALSFIFPVQIQSEQGFNGRPGGQQLIVFLPQRGSPEIQETCNRLAENQFDPPTGKDRMPQESYSSSMFSSPSKSWRGENGLIRHSSEAPHAEEIINYGGLAQRKAEEAVEKALQQITVQCSRHMASQRFQQFL